MVDLSVILPTFNEAGSIVPFLTNLESILEELKAQSEIVIVDDDSPDGTAQKIEAYAKDHPRIKLVVRKNDHGLGLSILEGIKHSSGAIIIGMDADFNHDPNVITSMLSALKKNDLVVASRFQPGGGMASFFRYSTSWGFNAVLQYLFHFPVSDNTSGYYVIRRADLEKLDLPEIYRGYGDYHLRLVWLARKAGLKLAEVPVFYGNRVAGVSKSRFFRMASSYLSEARRLNRD